MRTALALILTATLSGCEFPFTKKALRFTVQEKQFKLISATYTVMTEIGAEKGLVRGVEQKGIILFNEENGKAWVLTFQDTTGPYWRVIEGGPDVFDRIN